MSFKPEQYKKMRIDIADLGLCCLVRYAIGQSITDLYSLENKQLKLQVKVKVFVHIERIPLIMVALEITVDFIECVSSFCQGFDVHAGDR